MQPLGNVEMAIMQIAKGLEISNLLKMYELGLITFDAFRKSLNDICNFATQDVKKENELKPEKKEVDCSD